MGNDDFINKSLLYENMLPFTPRPLLKVHSIKMQEGRRTSVTRTQPHTTASLGFTCSPKLKAKGTQRRHCTPADLTEVKNSSCYVFFLTHVTVVEKIIWAEICVSYFMQMH